MNAKKGWNTSAWWTSSCHPLTICRLQLFLHGYQTSSQWPWRPHAPSSCFPVFLVATIFCTFAISNVLPVAQKFSRSDQVTVPSEDTSFLVITHFSFRVPWYPNVFKLSSRSSRKVESSTVAWIDVALLLWRESRLAALVKSLYYFKPGFWNVLYMDWLSVPSWFNSNVKSGDSFTNSARSFDISFQCAEFCCAPKTLMHEIVQSKPMRTLEKGFLPH